MEEHLPGWPGLERMIARAIPVKGVALTKRGHEIGSISVIGSHDLPRSIERKG